MNEKNYYTIGELAAEINKNRRTVWHWIKIGKLKSVRCGAEHRITKEDWQATHAAFNRRKGESLSA